MFRMVKSEEIEKQAIKLYIERKIRQAVIQILGIEKICVCAGFENMRKILSQKRLQMRELTLSKWMGCTILSRKKQNLRDNAGQ